MRTTPLLVLGIAMAATAAFAWQGVGAPESPTAEELPVADALIVAVAHRAFMDRPSSELLAKLRAGGNFIDVKSRFDRAALERAALRVWRL